MNNPYVMERYAQEKHADRVRKSTRRERAAASRRTLHARGTSLVHCTTVAMLAALAAILHRKR